MPGALSRATTSAALRSRALMLTMNVDSGTVLLSFPWHNGIVSVGGVRGVVGFSAGHDGAGSAAIGYVCETATAVDMTGS